MRVMDKIDIKGLTWEELSDIFVNAGFFSYSASQVFSWIYKKRKEDFSSMTDLSLKLRKFCQERFYFSSLECIDIRVSSDGTQKFGFKLQDGNIIESVLIKEKERLTLCVSSQVGCKFKCKFCVSGLQGFKRNLSASEIVNQYLFVQEKIYPAKINNIVFMGIGEPLDNFDNVVKAIKIFLCEKGIYMGKKKICISTVGIPHNIDRLRELNLGVKLSVSIHSCDDKKRTKIMPVNKKYNLKEVVKAIRRFIEETDEKVTIEYILIDGFNIYEEDVGCLDELFGHIKDKIKINLIPYNCSKYYNWARPKDIEIQKFKNYLKKQGFFFTLRESHGADIGAACGNLRATLIG